MFGEGMVAEDVRICRERRKSCGLVHNGFDLTLAYMVSGRLSDARNSDEGAAGIKKQAKRTICWLRSKRKRQYHCGANESSGGGKLEQAKGTCLTGGGELLVHRTLDPAVQVFEEGTRRFRLRRG